MKSSTIIGVVILAAALLAGAYYFYGHKSSVAGETAQQQEQTTAGETGTTGTKGTTGIPAAGGTTATPGKFSGSMSALAARGGEWKCTVDSSSDQTMSSGIVYVSNGKIRADFTTTVKGFGDIMSYMISDGSYVYTWSTAMPTGFKVPVSKKGTTAGPTTGQGSIDETHSYTYTCEAWSVNQTMFTPPNNVTFKSM